MSQEFSHPMKRVLSIDVFRGLTIVLMILVNAQGVSNSYPLLEHAKWHGLTLADLVFPFFLYIVGITTVISLTRRKNDLNSNLFLEILRRPIILIAIGIFINLFPHFNFTNIRYYGILQRIGICYFFSAILYLNTSPKVQIYIFWGILASYWFLMTQVPVPNFDTNQLTESGNWVAYIDRTLFSANHLFAKTNDPEGFLSTFPSLATTLLGILTGTLLLRYPNNEKIFFSMLSIGIIFLILSWFWNFSFPINKNVWSSSFVLLSGGYALILFALCLYIIDILAFQKWSLPFKIFGMNALFIFIFHVLLLKTMNWITLDLIDKPPMSVHAFIVNNVFDGFNKQNANLLFALCFIILNFLFALFLYRRKIFIKI